MLPTLKPGQDILVWCWFAKIKIGDIVAIKVGDKEMVKRISKFLLGDEPTSDQEKMIYVLGDNRKESIDSRRFGLIKKDQIIGKVIWSQ